MNKYIHVIFDPIIHDTYHSPIARASYLEYYAESDGVYKPLSLCQYLPDQVFDNGYSIELYPSQVVLF